MSLISIPGMSSDSLTNTDTKPTGGGLRPFPCDDRGWTQQTGVVLKCALKTLTDSTGKANDNISIQVGNGMYGGEILVKLDWRDVAPGVKDVAQAQEDNLKTLQKVIKILGCHTNGQLDTAKLEKAKGQCVAFVCKHKGFKEKDGRHYHNVGYIFKGQVDDIGDVVEVQMPPLPGSSAPAPRASSDDPFFS